MCPSHDYASTDDSGLRKVLVVQNEPTLRLGFSYALTNPSTTVETAASGTEALEMIEAVRFDLLILELRMPGMDGISVIENLRNRENHIPVVLCTALHRPNASLRAIDFGVTDFLIKPASPAEVRQVVEFVMNPPQCPLSFALKAVRTGNLDAAIRHLETLPNPAAKEENWLKALKLTKSARTDGVTTQLEEGVRSCFPMIAFNPPNTT